jgi:hypothetical protein
MNNREIVKSSEGIDMIGKVMELNALRVRQFEDKVTNVVLVSWVRK